MKTNRFLLSKKSKRQKLKKKNEIFEQLDCILPDTIGLQDDDK